MLRLAPALTLVLMLGPIVAGLLGTLLPSLGYLPAIGAETVSLDPWRVLLATPGIGGTLMLTVGAGFGATLASFLLAAGLCALLQGRPALRALERLATPLLAAPHAAVAIGFAFLILPSGWIARMVSPELSGWTRPPAWLVTARDPYGLSFAAGLVIKEAAFLVVLMAGAAGQAGAGSLRNAARALGYASATAWAKVVLPVIYPQIRLPLYAVLAYSLSSVETAIVLAPGTPPTLSVLAARWFSDFDLARYPAAAAAAMLQLLVVVLGILLWRAAELAAARIGGHWAAAGRRRGAAPALAGLLGAGALAVGAAGLLALLGMALWSFAAGWAFPDALPQAWGLAAWRQGEDRLLETAGATLLVGLLSGALALALALACLENEARSHARPGRYALLVLYLPLLVPQVAFLFGAQVALVGLGLDGTLLAVVWAHLLFVLPYVFLSLADPFRALDPRLARVAGGLGAAPLRIFLEVKLPLLLRPILVAAAVGFAVSVGQYLPTLFAGAGRVATLTTEAVALAAGGDRRLAGAYALLQSALPLLVYGAAILTPALLFRHRRGVGA